jgi:hypothetical protein
MSSSDCLHGPILAAQLAFPRVSGRWRLVLLVAGALAAVVLFVVLRSDDDESTSPPPPPPPPAVTTTQQPPPPPPPPTLEILIPINTDAITRRTIPRGRRVVLVVSGAEGEEVHLHGYDIRRFIGANGVARLPFRATIPGRFEVELEGSHRQIADLTVR